MVVWFSPFVSDLIEERKGTHCLPIASDAIGVAPDEIMVTGGALARCWVTGPEGKSHIIWYGIYDGDPYGLKEVP